jgi:hypothetical protein
MKILRPLEIDDAALLDSDVPEGDYTEWDLYVPYAKGVRVRFIGLDYHKVFESAVDANEGNYPDIDDGTHWLLVGSTNRWAMFDQSVGSQTVNPDSITVDIQTVGRVDSVALLTLDAVQAHVTQTDAVDGVVYDETFSLIDNSAVIDGYTYAFEPFTFIQDLAITDLKPYSNSIVGVKLLAEADTGALAKCGVCVVGLSRSLGGTQWSPTVGIQDYSVKEFDNFGQEIVVPRAFSKTANFAVWMATSAVSYLQNLLASYRTTPIVWIGDEGVGATVLLGFYKEFEIDVSYPDKSLCTLEIEGLT